MSRKNRNKNKKEEKITLCLDDIIPKPGEKHPGTNIMHSVSDKINKSIGNTDSSWLSINTPIQKYPDKKPLKFDPDNPILSHNKKKKVENKQKEAVNHPDHYKGAKFECIDVMVEIYGLEYTLIWCELTAFKYLYRCENKANAVEDIAKARWYIDWYLTHEKDLNRVEVLIERFKKLKLCSTEKACLLKLLEELS